MVGGGAATNSGMDFQARVGALVLVSVIAEVVDLHALGIGIVGETARPVRFETSDAVDDLVLVHYRKPGRPGELTFGAVDDPRAALYGTNLASFPVARLSSWGGTPLPPGMRRQHH